jgi:hypothetical protein
MKLIEKYRRRQQHINLIDYAPNVGNMCACGCGFVLTGKKKRWATVDCSTKCYEEFAIIKGNTSAIRQALFLIEGGYCRYCGAYDQHWQADHIIPVYKGGAGCNLSNFQTLCLHCHIQKTRSQRVGHLAPISSHAAVMASTDRLYAVGAVPKFFENISIEKQPLLSTSFSV